MARKRYFGDYPRIPGWRFVIQYEDGSIGHGTIYAHSIDDARIRLDFAEIGRPIRTLSIDPTPTER